MLKRIFILSFVSVLLTGCEDEFSPKAPYQERVVVFSVLDPDAPYQVVRLESTFDAELSDPGSRTGQREITEATVEVRSSRGDVYSFRDTLITLEDGSRKKVWINHALTPVEGQVFTLKVNVPGFEEITAETRVPSRSYVRLQGSVNGIKVSAVPNTAYPPSAWHFRLWVVGTKNVDGTDIEVRREVPVRFDNNASEWLFTEPSRNTEALFPLFNVERTYSDLRSIDSVAGRDVVATAYSLDVYVYSYYKLVRGFDDPVSVRQDRPDVSNVRNGVGIFGAMYSDSIRTRYSALVTR